MKAQICMPSYRGLSPRMPRLAAELQQRRGWYWPEDIGQGSSDIGKARDAMASHFVLNSDLPWTFWADDDMIIDYGKVALALAYARSHGLDVMGIIAPPGNKGSRTYACQLDPADYDTREDGRRVVRFGPKGRHYRAFSIGFGLVFVHRRVFTELIDSGLAKQCVLTAKEDPLIGWEFFPRGAHAGDTMKLADGRTLPISAGEDFGFSKLCRLAGIKMHVCTKYRCFHEHLYPYTWEDPWELPNRAEGDNLELLL